MADHGERETGLSGTLTAFGHRLSARVYYADTDFSGVVYHARYLEFLERGRSDFLRLCGVHHAELASGASGERIIWVVRRMEIDFRSPAKMDDILEIETRTEKHLRRAHRHGPAHPAGWCRPDRGSGRGGDRRRGRPAAPLSEGMDRRVHAAAGRMTPGLRS